MRQMHDLSRPYFSFGRMGRIIAPHVEYVLPGDRFQASFSLRIEMSPLNYKMRLDPRIDFYSFYVPIRQLLEHAGYLFDQNPMVKMLEEGIDYTGVNPFQTLAFVNEPRFLGYRFPLDGNGKYIVPMEYALAYIRIWDEYFRHPVKQTRILNAKTSLSALKTAILALLDTKKVSEWGLRANHLKAATTTFTDFDIDDADRKVSISSNKLDLIGLDKQAARLKEEASLELFQARYRDILADWGGKAEYDADNRPRMLKPTRITLQGANYGASDMRGSVTSRGQSALTFSHRVGPYRCNEHGVVITVGVVRLPVVPRSEIHQLHLTANRNYLGMMGNAAYIEVQEPHSVTDAKYFQGASDTTVRGYQPYANWLRYTPGYIHPLYDKLAGMPFMTEKIAKIKISEQDELDYDELYASTEFGHFELGGQQMVGVARALPTAARTMMPFSGGGLT